MIGFEAVDQIRKVTEAQFATSLAENVRDHVVTAVSSVRSTELAIQQGYFTKLEGLQELIEYMHHCYEVYAVSKPMGVVSYYLGNELNNYVGYTDGPVSAMVQFAGYTDQYYNLPVYDLSTGAFNLSLESAVFVSPYSTLDWPPYYLARDTGKPLWSDLYLFDPHFPNYIYLSYAHPVNYPNGTFCCVLFVDLTVGAFSQFLKSLPVVQLAKGLAMILDIDMSLVASSDPTQKALVYNASSPNLGDKVLGCDVQNPELSAGAKYYIRHFDGKHRNMTAKISTEGGTYFFQSSTIHIPNGNKTWILLTMQPRSYYFSKIDKVQYYIIVFSLVSITTGFIYRIFPLFRKWWRLRKQIKGAGMPQSNTTGCLSFINSLSSSNSQVRPEAKVESKMNLQAKVEDGSVVKGPAPATPPMRSKSLKQLGN